MISVELTQRFRARIQKLDLDPDAVFTVIQAAASAWGQPHQYTGLGIRRLEADFFEVRAGIGVRLVFRAQKTVLVFYDAGTHEDVRRFLRDL
jgi:hypothetical protein